VVIGLDVVDLTEPELRREILKLRRRVLKLTALLHLALALISQRGGGTVECSLLFRPRNRTLTGQYVRR
jgi:hypothetical protein